MTTEAAIEQRIIQKLQDLKYIYRTDIKDRKDLELNFKQKFEALNRVQLSEREYSRLVEQTITRDVFEASQKLRETQTLLRDDATRSHVRDCGKQLQPQYIALRRHHTRRGTNRFGSHTRRFGSVI